MQHRTSKRFALAIQLNDSLLTVPYNIRTYLTARPLAARAFRRGVASCLCARLSWLLVSF